MLCQGAFKRLSGLSRLGLCSDDDFVRSAITYEAVSIDWLDHMLQEREGMVGEDFDSTVTAKLVEIQVSAAQIMLSKVSWFSDSESQCVVSTLLIPYS